MARGSFCHDASFLLGGMNRPDDRAPSTASFELAVPSLAAAALGTAAFATRARWDAPNGSEPAEWARRVEDGELLADTYDGLENAYPRREPKDLDDADVAARASLSQIGV